MKPKKLKPAAVHSLRIPVTLLERITSKVKSTGKTKSEVMLAALARGLGAVR